MWSKCKSSTSRCCSGSKERGNKGELPLMGSTPFRLTSHPQEGHLEVPNKEFVFKVSSATPTSSMPFSWITSNIHRTGRSNTDVWLSDRRTPRSAWTVLPLISLICTEPSKVSQPSSPEAKQLAPTQAKLKSSASKK